MSKTFLIIHTSRIGGAEKRFFELWQFLAAKDVSYYLVLSKNLYQKLDIEKEPQINQVIFYDFELSTLGFANTSKTFIREYTKKQDIVHFIIDYPIIYTNRKTIYSITQSSLSNLNWKGKLMHLFGVLISNRVDVLDPSIYQTAKRWSFLNPSKLSLTSCSFCNTELYEPQPKENWIVFLGRFFYLKQVVPFVRCIPAIYKKCKEQNIKDVQFFILGHGEQEEEIKNLISHPAYEEISIKVGFEREPNNILNKSKVFLSLQKENNYPSRSLIEAFASGNMAVVTDNGQTRWLAKPEFSEYVNESFTDKELVEAIYKCLAMSEEEFSIIAGRARNFILENHNVEKMATYFQICYNQIK